MSQRVQSSGVSVPRTRVRAASKTAGPDQRSRERIHRAALARFARYGYEAVSLQQIADDVGLHKSSLFHHYRGKSALLKEVLAEVMQRILLHVRPLKAQDRPSAESLLTTVYALADHFCDEPEAARLLLALMTAPEDSELRRQEADALEFYETVATFLDRARRIGVIGRIRIRHAIPNLIGLILVYPAIAHDLSALIGKDAFSAKARQGRRQDLERAVRALLQLS
jgi:AcrR family transcriptional regulator